VVDDQSWAVEAVGDVERAAGGSSWQTLPCGCCAEPPACEAAVDVVSPW
jgi:hypothetical protein